MFRTLSRSKIAFILAILFGLSLFFFRGSSRYSNLFNSDNVIASISGTPISTNKFTRTLQLNINQFSNMFGRNITKEDIKSLQIHSLALGALINNAVFENEFDLNNYIIDDKILAKKTKDRLPQLYDKNNKLKESALNIFLRDQGLKIDDIVNIINFETRSEVFDKFFFQINYPDYFTKKINIYDQHKRDIEILKIDINDLPENLLKVDNINKENEEIKSFYEENKNKYMTNEERNISYLIFSKDNYKDRLKPTENEILNYYNNNINLYLISETRDFTQFNFKTKEEAIKFKDKINGLKINEIKSISDENNIIYNDFKDLSKNEVIENLSEEIFALEIDDISEIIETPLAFHIILLNNIKKEKQKSFEEAKSEIEESILSIEINNFFNDLKNNISQQILDGYSIEEIANRNSSKVENLLNVDKLNSNNLKLKDIEKEIIKKSFITNKDFVSDVIEFNQNSFFILNVDKIIPSENIDYNDIFTDIKNDWVFSKKIEFLNNNHTNNYKNEKYLEETSNKLSQELKKIIITKNYNEVPRDFLSLIFNTNINNPIIYNEGENFYIVNIKNIIIDENNTENYSQISLNADLKNAYGSEIIKNKKIKINENLLEALINQY